jgi:RNA polymerase sigma-32 factor
VATSAGGGWSGVGWASCASAGDARAASAGRMAPHRTIIVPVARCGGRVAKSPRCTRLRGSELLTQPAAFTRSLTPTWYPWQPLARQPPRLATSGTPVNLRTGGRHLMHMTRNDDAGFARYVADVKKYPRLDRESEQRLARRFHRKDRDAGDQLLRANLRYVVSIALQYRGYGLRMADLVAEGNIGLCEALRRFDPARNLRFMTYASYWIRAYVLAYILKHHSIVGIGTGPLQSKMFFRMHRERAKIAQETGDEGDASSLARVFRASEERVGRIAQRLDSRDLSLDVQVYRDGELTLGETLRDDSDDQETHASESERDERVRAAIHGIWTQLDERERLIVTERLWTEGEEATLADLGRRLRLSRERVRQLEERVKRKLRRALQPVALAA